MVGRRPVHLGDDPYALRPPGEAGQAAGGSLILVCRPSGHGTLGEYLHGTERQGKRRTAGRGSGKRPHRYRRMAGPPLRDGADALRVTRPEVGVAKPDGRVTCRNGFVTDLDIAHDNVVEIVACGRARRRIGNGTFNVPGPTGTTRSTISDTGGGPANLPMVPDLPAFAAHAACDLNETARQRARRTLGARKRLSDHMRTSVAHVVFPSWAGPVATPRHPP